MALEIAIIKETVKNEKRVAASPETVKKLVALGAVVKVQKGAGKNANFNDAAFKEAGAKVIEFSEASLKKTNIILCVQTKSASNLSILPNGAFLIGLVDPFNNKDAIKSFASKNINIFAVELMPRISRAQSMDVLSSQSNLAGYKAVLDATEYYNRALPMMMTAAGTVAPAKIFVMGAGVAGLQAIATAKRLGAVVSATDVRPAAKEQVQSLGGTFIAVEDDEFKEAESAGGYAKEMSKAYQKKQAELVAQTIAKQDIVITTALIPGRPAPKLIDAKMIKSMKEGSVIVDMAVEAGGNVEGAKLDQVVQKDNVTIIGHENIASRLSTDASTLYAKNLFNLLTLMINKKDTSLNIDWEDEIIKNIALTKDGSVIHPAFTNKKDNKEAA